MSKFLTETQDPSPRGGTPVNAVQAELTVDPAGTNNAVKFTAKQGGRRGNRISVEYRHDVGPTAAHLVKAGVSNTLRFDARTPGDAGDAITVATLDPAAPNAPLGVREYAGNVNVDLATDFGDKATASLPADSGSVEIEVNAPGPGGNDYTVETVRQDFEGAPLAVDLVGSALTVKLGMDHGDNAFVIIADGAIGLETVFPVLGSEGNAYTVEVVEGPMVEDTPMTAELYGTNLTIALGRDVGDAAAADIGDGSVRVEAVTPGSSENDLTIEVAEGAAEDGALAVGLAFDVLDVPDLQGWYDASQLTLNDGDPVDSWTDESGQGNHATKTGANRPTFKTGRLNGLPAINFDGADDFLTLPTGMAVGDATVFAVFDRVSGTNAHYTLVSFGDAATKNLQIRIKEPTISNGHMYFEAGDGGEGGTGVDMGPYVGDDFEPHMIAARHTKEAPYGELLFKVDRVAAFNGTFDPAVSANGNEGHFGVRVGDSNFWKDDISEIIIFSRALTDQEVVDVEAYLSDKYFGTQLQRDFRVTLGMDKGDKATATIGLADSDGVKVEMDEPGSFGNIYEVQVLFGEESGVLATAELAGILTVTLGMDAGAKATADLTTSSPAGAIRIEVDAPGSLGNDYEVQVIQGVADAVLSAWLYANTLTIELPADPYGTPIHAHADDVIAAINDPYNPSVSDVFTASLASGQMSSEVGVQGPTAFFDGGFGFAPDAAQNTTALVAASINAAALYPFPAVTATALGPYGSLLSSQGPNPFEGGGANLAPDPAKNTAELVVAEIIASAPLLTAVDVPYVGNDPLTAADVTPYPINLVGGGENPQLDPAKNTPALIAAAIAALVGSAIDPVALSPYPLDAGDVTSYPLPFHDGGANLGPKNTENTTTLVAAAINAAEGATFTATAVLDVYDADFPRVTETYPPVAFAGGGDNSVIISTGAQVAAAVDAGSTLVTCDVVAGNGALPATPFAAENLHGGSDFGEGEALEVETSGNAVIVHLETEPYEGTIVTTAQDILDAVGMYHPLVDVEAAEAYSDGVVTATAAARLTGGTPSGPVSVEGTILEDAQYRYTAFEDALERDDLDFEGHWDRLEL